MDTQSKHRQPPEKAPPSEGKGPRELLVDDTMMARLLGVSLSWLRHDRIGPRQIPFCRLGGRVLYSPSRVAAALDHFEEGGPNARRRRNVSQ